jgi:hypothetical protein
LEGTGYLDMEKEFTLILSSLDVGQLLDGLRLREEAWRGTANLLRDGYHPEEDFSAEECSKWEEAKAIADHYQKIIDEICRQITAQGGWGT